MTSAAVARARRFLPAVPRRWLVAGGGRHNGALMEALAAALECGLFSAIASGKSTPAEIGAFCEIDPETADRDLNIPKDLQRGFGHVDLGVYGCVTAAGWVAAGDRLVSPD